VFELYFLNRFYDIKNNFIKIKNIILINFKKKNLFKLQIPITFPNIFHRPLRGSCCANPTCQVALVIIYKERIYTGFEQDRRERKLVGGTSALHMLVVSA